MTAKSSLMFQLGSKGLSISQTMCHRSYTVTHALEDLYSTARKGLYLRSISAIFFILLLS